jgi:uncharacterized protein
MHFQRINSMDSTPEQPLASSVPISSVPEPPVPDPATLPPTHTIFCGPFGLRAGWSLLIYFAIIATLGLGIYLIGHQIHTQREHVAAIAAAKTGKPAAPLAPLAPKSDPHAPAPLAGAIFGEIILFAVFFLLSLLMAYIEHRKLSAFGLGSGPSGGLSGARSVNRALIGAIWGIIAISLLVGALHIFHFLTFDSLLDHGPKILLWGGIQLFFFFLVGLTEEYLFRGYVQFTLTRGMVSIGNLISPRHARAIAFWIASVLTSALFLYAHTSNGGETPLGLFQVFLAGVVFVVALWRTGSLWWGIGFHMAWDWGQSFLYGVPDSGGLIQGRLFATHASGNPLYSGGTTGPEGSILCIPIFFLVIAILFFTHPSPQPPLELPGSPLTPHPESSALPYSSEAPPELA